MNIFHNIKLLYTIVAKLKTANASFKWDSVWEKLNKVYTAGIKICISLTVLIVAWQLITDVVEDKIVFEPFTVALTIKKQGVGGALLVGKVLDRINMIRETVRRNDREKFVKNVDIKVESDIQVPGTEVSLKDISDFLRMFLGISVRTISGNVSLFEDKQFLSIRILNRAEKTFSGPLGEISTLTDQAAEYILMVLDPFTIGKYYSIQKDGEAIKNLVNFIRSNKAEDKEIMISYLIDGMRFFDSGDYKRALDQWEIAGEIAEEIGSANINALVYQGWALDELKRYEEAIGNYKKVLELDYENPAAINNLGLSFYKLNERKKAIKEFKKLIKIAPEYSQGYNNLGYMLLEEEKYEEGITYIRKAIRLNPDDPEFYRSLGDGLFATGKYAQAIEHFRTVLKFLPDDALAYMLWGKCLEELGQKQEAEEKYKKYRELNSGKSQG
jgi:tetratricopeptide (TPR) repeat protein